MRALPTPPAGFSGLVGDFRASSEVSKRELAVGDSLTQTIRVGGSGNVQLIPEPQSSISTLDFKVYPERPTMSIDRGGGSLRGERTFRRALLPLRAGDLSVQAVSLVYFDPDAEVYRESVAEAIDLVIRPSEGVEDLRLTESLAPTTGKVAVQILADGLLPIHRGSKLLANGTWSRFTHLAATASPPALFFALLVVVRRRERNAQGDPRLRRKAALRKATKQLAKLEESDWEVALSKTIRRFVGDCLGVEGMALTAAECAAGLRDGGVDDETLTELESTLGALEGAQYARNQDDVAKAEPSSVRRLLRKLDLQLR